MYTMSLTIKQLLKREISLDKFFITLFFLICISSGFAQTEDEAIGNLADELLPNNLLEIEETTTEQKVSDEEFTLDGLEDEKEESNEAKLSRDQKINEELGADLDPELNLDPNEFVEADGKLDQIDILADELLPDMNLEENDDELLPDEMKISEQDVLKDGQIKDDELLEEAPVADYVTPDPEPHEKYRLIPRGKIIYELKTKKALRLNNDLMVKIEDYEEDSEFITIETKDKKKKYLVHFKALENLNQVLALKRPPKYFQEVSFKETRKEIIKKYHIDQSLNVMMGIGIVSFLPQRKKELANTNNIYYRAYFNTKKRWHLGVNLNWENVDSVGQRNNYSYNGISIGPNLKFENIINKIDFTLGLSQSFSSALKIEQGRIRFNQTTIFTSLERKTEYALGTFLLGVNFNLSRLKIKDSNVGAYTSGALDTHYAVGFMVGHGFY